MARADEGLEATVVGRVRESYVDDDGVTVITDLTVDGVSIFRRHPGGTVDDGPDRWAVLLAAAIVSLSIALAILVEGLI